MNRLVRLLVSLGALVFLPVILSAQAPGAFKYQAVARDNTGQIIADQDVSMKVSIIQGNPLGAVAYCEIHYKKTNEFGLINFEIGNGTVISGDFSAIKWGEDKYFLKVEMDPAGGSSFEEMGTSQIFSVPYALFAGEAGNVDDADADPANEIQLLSISNDTLYLTNGGFIKLPAGSLNSSPDIDTAGIQPGDLLSWNGNKWIPVETAGDLSYYYADRDEDGYGDDYSTIYSPEAPSGYVSVAGDCKDYDPDVYTGHTEDCDGKDNNCDGEIDEGCDQDNDGLKDYLDNCPYNYNPGQENFDEDEFGDICDDDDDNDGDPDATDCNDQNAAIYNGATEICNGIDDNCNGSVDENTCPPTSHVVLTNCAGVSGCQIITCDAGYGDLDSQYNNGCECGPDMYEDNNNCMEDVPLGDIEDTGDKVFVTGKISTLSDVDYYSVQAIDNLTGDYLVRIRFQINPSDEFRFDVYSISCTTLLASNQTDYYYYNTAADDSRIFIIRVYRRSGATASCNSYQIELSNGAY